MSCSTSRSSTTTSTARRSSSWPPLTNALRVVGKRIEDVTSWISGVGAAGHAIIRLLHAGRRRHHRLRPHGAVHAGQPTGTPSRAWIAENTNADARSARCARCSAGADVFIGVSAPNLLTGDDIATMAEDAIVFALANPDPRSTRSRPAEHAAVVATGRSDFPNQINNVLAFPGFFRGMLDAGAREITEEMLVAAADRHRRLCGDDELNASYIVPSSSTRRLRRPWPPPPARRHASRPRGRPRARTSEFSP